MQQQSTTQTKKENEIRHWITDLIGIRANQVAFVLGNGYSISFYDSRKMKQNGILIGCNLSFKIHPLDYLCWQDSGVHEECKKFQGPKVVPLHKENRETLDKETTYYFAGGATIPGTVTRRLKFGHTGLLAVQLAYLMGCNPIILAGCDCCLLGASDFPKRSRHKEFTIGGASNIFKDKHIGRGKIKHPSGWWTTDSLQSFARSFRQLIVNDLGKEREFFRLGEWGILDFLPVIEIEEYWSDKHPRYKIAQ